MNRNLLIAMLTTLSVTCSVRAQTLQELTPMDIQFRRQAVRRLVFDRGNAIPLATLNPAEVINLSVEYPVIPLSDVETDYDTASGKLRIAARDASESARWVGGFNPYATYEVSFEGSNGQAVEAGVEFATPDNRNRLIVLAGFRGNECRSMRYQVMVRNEGQDRRTARFK